MKNSLPLLLIITIWCGSVALALLPLFLLDDITVITSVLGAALVPIIFVLSFSTIAGALSRIGQKGIVRGRFPREPLHPVYLLRRIYGICWTQVYYFKPLYAVVLSIPLLKKAVFRLFGYKGSNDFTVYPDTWIRDLPLLDFGAGSYLANRSTVGTNMCLIDGSIVVGNVRLGSGSMLGHLAMTGPGATIGKTVEIGIGAGAGPASNLGDRVEIGPGAVTGVGSQIERASNIGARSTISHGVQVGEESTIGIHSYVGTGAVIGSHVSLPAGVNVPAGAKIMTQADVASLVASEISLLEKHKAELLSSVAAWTTTAV